MTKGRITKKVVALATTAMMLFAMVIPAAANPGTGKITVHKYVRDSVGVPHPDNEFSGEQLSGADLATLGQPLAGAGFTLYELNMAAVNAAVADGNTVTGYTTTANSVVFTLDGQGTPPATTLSATATAIGSEEFTDNAGQIVFGGSLADGYYMLRETNPPIIPGSDPATPYAAAADSVIKMPLTLNDGSGVNRDIHVYPKNVNETAAVVGKTMNGVLEAINTGDNVPFRISTLFKNADTNPANQVNSVNDLMNGGVYGSVKLTDALESYFTYQGVTAVYLEDGAGERITGAHALDSADYTVAGSVGTAGETLVVTLTNSGIEKAVAANANALVVEFNTTFTGGASASNGVLPTHITNEATSEVIKAGGTTPDTVTPPAVLNFPAAAIIVDKLNEAGNKFAGATFALAKVAVPTVTYSEDAWDNGTFTPSQLTALASEYVLDANGKPVSGTTDVNGVLTFNNVPYEESTGATYYLKELSTVAGYELPSGTIAVTLAEKTAATNASQLENGEWKNGAVVSATVEVVNYPQGTDLSFSLPLTGGAGTILFTAIGIVVMLGAAVVYLHGKKKNI